MGAVSGQRPSVKRKRNSSKSSNSSPRASSDARGRRRADDFDADHGQPIDQVDGASPGREAPALGEQVLFCKLLRDGILKHFNPYKLRDLQYILELRCFKGLLSDDDLKHLFESSLEGECEFELGDLRGSETLDELRKRVRGVHMEVTERLCATFPPHFRDSATLRTKEAVLREYKMLTYVPSEVYRSAVGGAHVLREVRRLGLRGGCSTVDKTTIGKQRADMYLSLACRAGLPASVAFSLFVACPSVDAGEGLKQAVRGNHLDLVDLLSDANSTRVPRDCLVGTVDTAHVGTVRYLVEHGADVHARSRVGSTVLHDAALGGNLDVARFLVEKHGADVHAKDDDGITVLHDAAVSGNLDLVRFLVEEHGADVHAKDDDGKTPLHQAAKRGALDVVRFLVEKHGADVNAWDADERTVLYYAAVRSNLDVVRFLVDERGADVNAWSWEGWEEVTLTTDPMCLAFLRDRRECRRVR